jgi:Helix-hairpin-helix motif
VNKRIVSALVCVLVLLHSPAARAVDYGVFIDIETEEDLLDLKNSGDITDATFETLKELLDDGVNLNTANRGTLYSLPNVTYKEVDAILAFRSEAGRIADPADLVKAGAISARKIGAIAPFLLIKKQTVKLYATKGIFKYGISYMVGDKTVPSMFLSARIATLRHMTLGLTMVLTRDWLDKPVWDPNREALASNPPQVRLHVPKFYLQYKTPQWEIMAGTFRIGFGQRLTFDNTGYYSPNGIRIDDSLYKNQKASRTCRESAGELLDSPCGGDNRYQYHSPDFKWTNRLRGLAFGIKKIKVGKTHWMQAYGFFSHQTHNIYQYEIYNRMRCDDPRNDDLPECAAPSVFRIQDDRLASTSRFSFYTLPAMYNEMLGGGNLTYFLSRRVYFGVTGYGSDVKWLVDGADLDFQEWNKMPYGGPFGAIGVNAAWGKGIADVFAEVAHTFDSMPEGDDETKRIGGFGAILRSVFTIKKHEVEVAARYYDKAFANPHGRPIASPDEFDGNRHRDELGLRVKYKTKLKDIYLRTLLDWWTAPSDWNRLDLAGDKIASHKLRARARVDYELATWFKPGVWGEYQDKGLEDTSRSNCYAITDEYDLEGEPITCQGEKFDLGLQLKFLPLKKLSLTAYGMLRFVDDNSSRFDDKFRKDFSAWFLAMYKPIKDVRLRARVRYRIEAVSSNQYLEQSIWAYLEASWWYKRTLRLKGRVELLHYLDDRGSSLARSPNPEVWARVEVEYRF